MTKTRLEAFSDGVIAIIITIMVLELKKPHGYDWHALQPVVNTFICYILSFVFIGIYWGNHHHLVHTVHEVNSKIMWANMHLLFWLSLVPFATAWMGENDFEPVAVAGYGLLLLVCGISYNILQWTIRSSNKENTALIKALKKQDKKGIISAALYALSVPMAFVHSGISACLFVFVAVMWIIPDPNIEKALKGD